MDSFIIGIALLFLIAFSSSRIEGRLKSLEETNKRVIEILEEIRDKK